MNCRPADSLWTVVLAAGGSQRLGRPKQLLRHRSRTLLDHTTRIATELTPGRVVVVLGAGRLRLLRHLRQLGRPVGIRINKRWQQGMSGTLALGLGALPASAAAALILVTDQPFVTARDLARLVACWRARPSQPAAASYAGRLGVPAIIPRSRFAGIPADAGDRGARELLRAGGATVRGVPIAKAAFDIDTAGDAAVLSRQLPASDPVPGGRSRS